MVQIAQWKRQLGDYAAEAVGYFAGQYAGKIYDRFMKGIYDFANGLDSVGASVIRAASNQFRGYLQAQISGYIKSLVKEAILGEKNTFTWEGFDFDLKDFGVTVLQSYLNTLPEDHPLNLAFSVYSGVGGVLTGPVWFEIYVKTFFVFAGREEVYVTPVTSESAALMARRYKSTFLRFRNI